MEGRLELEEPADGSAGRKVQVGVQANPNSFSRGLQVREVLRNES